MTQKGRIPLLLAAGLLAATVWPTAGRADAQVNTVKQQLDAMKARLSAMQKAYEEQIRAMEARLRELEARQQAATEAAEAAAVAAELEVPVPAATPSQPLGAPTASTSWLQMGLDGLFVGGGSSASGGDVEKLQYGGHDPTRDGFTLQQVELSLNAAVDPYFDAQAFLVFVIDNEGRSAVEIEEANLVTRALPGGLQIKAGQFFTEFGRHNHTHPHTWAFLDQPVIISRLFGKDSLRSQGARVSWLTPLPWYSELLIGAQNARGETITSFLANGPGEAGDDAVGGHRLIDRTASNFGDLLYSFRLLNGFDIGDSTSVNVGFSGLLGPNASGNSTDSWVIGSDLYFKWQPPYLTRGFPFVSFQGEAMLRHYQAGDITDPTHENLKDWGAYGQALWGFRPGWVAGLRFDYADSSGGLDRPGDFLRDTRKRLSPNLTWYPTEFSKFRLQYNHDWTDFLTQRTADALWLQFEFAIGSHLAHVF